MAIQDWSLLLRKMTIVGGPLNTVTLAEISQFEAVSGFRLPISYKRFCEVFGLGTLARPSNFQIAIPRLVTTNPSDNLIGLNQEAKDYKHEYKYYCKDMPRFERAYFFAIDIGTYYYFWDQQEITNKGDSEYCIYVLYRDWRIEKLSDSFWDFVTDVCLKHGVREYGKGGDACNEPNEWIFEPYL